jgi:hypothetical protein
MFLDWRKFGRRLATTWGSKGTARTDFVGQPRDLCGARSFVMVFSEDDDTVI